MTSPAQHVLFHDDSAKLAGVAAAWWRARIEAPKFDAIGSTQRDAPMHLAQDLAAMNVRAASGEQFIAFERELTKVLLERRPLIVDVDYDPDDTLWAAAKEAEVDRSRFPWKTTMWMDWRAGRIRTRSGYGRPIEPLWPEVQ
jgi:hypothetical protein